MDNNEKNKRLRELFDKYLEYYGEKFLGKESDGAPLMPFLLIDNMQSIYVEWIAKIELKQDLKRFRNEWHKNYLRFIKQFFAPFTLDEQCEITDLMDEFTEQIKNQTEIFRVTVMNHLMNQNLEHRLVASAVITCGSIVQYAMAFWKITHLVPNNQYLDAIDFWCNRFMQSYKEKYLDNSEKVIDLNKFNDLKKISDKLTNDIINFAKNIQL